MSGKTLGCAQKTARWRLPERRVIRACAYAPDSLFRAGRGREPRTDRADALTPAFPTICPRCSGAAPGS
nr:MAG TPA: hypothetical protein [Caudoviricetes sp.]